VPPLTGLLGDREPIVRRRAAEALGRIGPDAGAALAALRRLASDPEADVRAAAAEAVRRIAQR
jgi:HEAT repeat protein